MPAQADADAHARPTEPGMKRIIDVEEPQVGERYLVPVVRELRVGPRGLRIVGDLWVPVIGPLHDDTEIIGLPARHWHVDFRFAGARVLLRMATIRPPITADGDDDLVEKCMTRVITDDPEWTWAGREDGERALTMLRPGRGMPFHNPRDDDRTQPLMWLRPLEAAYYDARLPADGCRACPHRGLPLRGQPVDEEGGVTCPGHGLRWHAVTGRHMPRRPDG
jgi:hypothetical protein